MQSAQLHALYCDQAYTQNYKIMHILFNSHTHETTDLILSWNSQQGHAFSNVNLDYNFLTIQ